MKKDFKIKTSAGENLNLTAYGAFNNDVRRCIIYVHGFKGFKDWGFVPYIAEFLAQRDLPVITFNFSHNGIGDNPLEFTELDKFSKNTFSLEITELSEVIEAVHSGRLDDSEIPSIGLLGHSRGGGITLLTAAGQSAVRAAATWSSVATFNRYKPEEIEKWRREGKFDVVNTRTGQVMSLGLELLNDLEANKDGSLNIEKAVTGFNRPLLIVHGEKDESVPVAEADRIFGWSNNPQSELLKVPETGHTFGAVHPFIGSNPVLDNVLDKTAVFFEKHL